RPRRHGDPVPHAPDFEQHLAPDRAVEHRAPQRSDHIVSFRRRRSVGAEGSSPPRFAGVVRAKRGGGTAAVAAAMARARPGAGGGLLMKPPPAPAAARNRPAERW